MSKSFMHTVLHGTSNNFRLNFCRTFHIGAISNKNVTARYKNTKYRTKPLTYEMAQKPHAIAHRKAWNSWNTTSLKDGWREPETAIEDIFIRKFMKGTWHNCFVSEIIIKRQHNIIRIAGIIHPEIRPVQMYFLIGYCEDILMYWLKCPVKLELQVVKSKEDVVYKYI